MSRAPMNILEDRRWMAAAVLLFAVMMTIKYFPGAENHSLYIGNIFQTIHPDAFAGDFYKGPEKPFISRPSQMSLFYGAVYLMGEIWLDDRFVAAVYLGLVFAALLGVERIAAHLGLANPLARLALLLLIMKDHEIFDKVLMAYHADVNHSAFAIPLTVWLMYAALARKGWFAVLALMAVLAAVSPRNAAGPMFLALCVQAYHGGPRTRAAVGVFLAAGFAAVCAAAVYVFPVQETHRLELWDYIRARQDYEANPWHMMNMTRAFWNAVWLAMIGGGLWICVRQGPRFHAVAVVLVLGLFIWLAGGLYISFAPDALKQPLLIGFVPARMLGTPQLLATVVITVFFMNMAERERTPKALAFAAAALTALYMTGPGEQAVWFVLVIISSSAAVLGATLWARRSEPRTGFISAAAARPAAVIAAALIFATTAVYTRNAVRHWPYWRTLAEHGVYGAASSAVWIGVDSYVRKNTPPGSSILPYHFSAAETLAASRSLGVRTGRTSPVPTVFSDITSSAGFKFENEQRELGKKIGEDFMAGNALAARPRIERLAPVPDYIIAPSAVAAGLDWAVLKYTPEAEVRDFIIAKRSDGSGG